MNQSDSVQLMKEATALVPSAARERVWRRLGTERPAPARGLWVKGLTFAACTAAGFAIVFSLSLRSAPTVFGFEHAVATSSGRVTRGADGTLQLAQGWVLVSSWGAPGIKVWAPHSQIEAQAAVFSVDVAAQLVAVDVREGEVRVNGERIVAGRQWPQGQRAVHDFAELRKLEPARASEERAWALAESALDTGQFPEALQRFDALGGQGLRAEAALLKKGELQLRQLGSPADALATFDEAHRRFPSGSLGQEVALSSLEAMLSLEKWSDARTRAKDFLARFPDSERQLEVRYVCALAAWRLNDKAAACAEISGLQLSAFSGQRRATLDQLAAQCTLFER